MKENTGHYAVITKKFRLITDHGMWIETTRDLYNEVIGFYYRLFIQYSEVQELSNQKAMRRLEELSVMGRNKLPVPEPLPWDKLPLYFRRSAISQAVASGKSFLSRENQIEPTQSFDMSIVLYKGMYKDLGGHKVKIHLYDGNAWHWVQCRLTGNHLLENEEWMSPRLVTVKKRFELHIPVRMPVSDGRTLKNRIDEQLRICSIQFFNSDVLAVCCIMDIHKNVQAVKFVRGGNDYKKRCNYLQCRIKKSRDASGNIYQPNANRRYWKKISHINEDMAHQISRQLVDFAKENQAAVIVLPKYTEEFSRYVMAAVGKWSPVYLNYRIREKLNYKAWQAGILIAEANVKDVRRCCAVCGNVIREKGESFICSEGHQGDRRLNTVRNLGRNFIDSMTKQR